MVLIYIEILIRYNFNDSIVSEIDINEISSKSFGGFGCAYMLFYKQVENSEEFSYMIPYDKIPSSLLSSIESEKFILHIYNY